MWTVRNAPLVAGAAHVLNTPMPGVARNDHSPGERWRICVHCIRTDKRVGSGVTMNDNLISVMRSVK